MMRTGPGQNYPGTWLYVRRDLPIRVVEIYRNWRKIQDPDGTTGWMLVNLLSDQRTAIVRGDGAAAAARGARRGLAGPLPRRARRGRPASRAAPAAGAISTSAAAAAIIRIDQLWGVDPSETIR